MKTITVLLAAATLLLGASASPLATRKSNSWAGTSLYYLHGLADSEQDAYLSALASDGAKVVRIWVKGIMENECVKGNNMANGCDEFEDTIGNYNYCTLDLLDATIVKIAKNGMKALISPHNANLLSTDGGYTKDVYGNTWGSGNMYTSPDAAKAYDNRLSAILNYQGKYSGQVWKNWNDAIMGFDIENEAMLADNKYRANDPTGWICARAAHMRSELGGENPIKVASGGVGGTFANGANLASWVVSCPNVDIASVHYYSDSGFSQSNFIGQANGKLVHIEEWTTHQGSGQAAEYASDAAHINALGIPWCLWEVLPSQTCSVQDSDNTGLVINGGIDVAGPMQAADNTAGAQDWTGIIY